VAVTAEAKRALVKAWGDLSPQDRRAFLSRVHNPEMVFVPPSQEIQAANAHPMVQQILEMFPTAYVAEVRPSRQDIELMQAIADWSRVLRSSLDENERGFCLGIAKKLKRPDWEPGKRERDYMISLRHQKLGVDPEVLEDIDLTEED
jgi:hypothetical protein